MDNFLEKDFKIFINFISLNCGLQISNYKINDESKEYGARLFVLNTQTIQFRISKITPTKTGQFVTIWKRNAHGITVPFDESDELDYIIISGRKENNLGYFIFPKRALIEHGIISVKNKTGKRGIRVYPSWDVPENKQAIKTQKWQLQYFLNMSTDNQIDINFFKHLIS